MASDRRTFIKGAAAGITAAAFLPAYSLSNTMDSNDTLFFKVSLAQWSLHRTLKAGEMDNLDFPAVSRERFDIHAVEYVNQFFPSSSEKYTRELLKRSEDAGVKNLLIMIDGEGDFGELYAPKRSRTVERHYEWVECAKLLGCHSIRVNARGNGDPDDVASATVESLGRLSEFAKAHDINVLVENHGGLSSNGKWLANVMKQVNMDNCGTLPDFGNFNIGNGEQYDRYLGVKELMPFAKGVSAKSHDFDEDGNETGTDYARMLSIVKESAYKGYIGIEYEGNRLSESDGILATKELLLKAGRSIA